MVNEYMAGCQCGEIRLIASGEPVEGSIRFCHCRMCQRASGAPFMMWATYRSNMVRRDEGIPATYASSEKHLRHICRTCGTQLLRLEVRGFELGDTSITNVDVAIGTLDDPGALVPTHHVWVESKIPWLKIGDGLPQYPQDRYACEPA